MHRLTLVLTLALIACEHPAAEGPAAPAQPAAPSATTSAPAATANAPGAVIVRTADGAEAVSVREESNGTITIAFDKQTLRGTTRDTGKRKYGDPATFEIKPGDDGFKLRHADGKLLWKVKFKDGKIKISDNEENLNPFELKTRGDGLKVVAPGERELGDVRGSDVSDATGKKRFTVDGKSSAAYGVLLLDTIPPPQRYILLAELLSRGK
ncbi:MAG TPA: hypothetical protein VN181_00655 [Thermoanaerobaculia bacterium]|nr:hypothetical protein [Thermoanaerobaculia bacterium]